MKKIVAGLLILVAGASLVWCSRSEPPAPPPAAQAPPAAETPAPAAMPPAIPAAAAEVAPEPQDLPADLVTRLVRPHSPIFGPANARVTVVEVLDPACGACAAFAPVVEQIMFLYPKEVRVVVRYADFHPASLQAIRLLEAARAQNKVHKLLTALFERQPEWAAPRAPNPAQAWIIASEVGVDMGKARQDALAASVDDMLSLEAEDLTALKVAQTPTFFVNGKPLPVFGADELMALVASEVQKR
jgi:protein-disulfide isomerase